MSPSARSAQPPAPSASSQTLPRQCRVRRRRHFLAIQARGVKVHGQHLICIAARGNGATAKLGVTASKKVGKAVARNRAKRLIKEGFRKLRGGLPPWLDVVVIARRSLLEASAGAVAQELERCLGQAIARVQRRR